MTRRTGLGLIETALVQLIDERVAAVKAATDEGLICHLDVGSKQLQRQCREAIKAGEIPGHKIGALYHLRRADWDAYLERHRVRPRAGVTANDTVPAPAPAAPGLTRKQQLAAELGLARAAGGR